MRQISWRMAPTLWTKQSNRGPQILTAQTRPTPALRPDDAGEVTPDTTVQDAADDAAAEPSETAEAGTAEVELPSADEGEATEEDTGGGAEGSADEGAQDGDAEEELVEANLPPPGPPSGRTQRRLPEMRRRRRTRLDGDFCGYGHPPDGVLRVAAELR